MPSLVDQRGVCALFKSWCVRKACRLAELNFVESRKRRMHNITFVMSCHHHQSQFLVQAHFLAVKISSLNDCVLARSHAGVLTCTCTQTCADTHLRNVHSQEKRKRYVGLHKCAYEKCAPQCLEYVVAVLTGMLLYQESCGWIRNLGISFSLG